MLKQKVTCAISLLFIINCIYVCSSVEQRLSRDQTYFEYVHNQHRSILSNVTQQKHQVKEEHTLIPKHHRKVKKVKSIPFKTKQFHQPIKTKLSNRKIATLHYTENKQFIENNTSQLRKQQPKYVSGSKRYHYYHPVHRYHHGHHHHHHYDDDEDDEDFFRPRISPIEPIKDEIGRIDAIGGIEHVEPIEPIEPIEGIEPIEKIQEIEPIERGERMEGMIPMREISDDEEGEAKSHIPKHHHNNTHTRQHITSHHRHFIKHSKLPAHVEELSIERNPNDEFNVTDDRVLMFPSGTAVVNIDGHQYHRGIIGAKGALGVLDPAMGATGAEYQAKGAVDNRAGVIDPAKGVTNPATGVTDPATGVTEEAKKATGAGPNSQFDKSKKLSPSDGYKKRDFNNKTTVDFKNITRDDLKNREENNGNSSKTSENNRSNNMTLNKNLSRKVDNETNTNDLTLRNLNGSVTQNIISSKPFQNLMSNTTTNHTTLKEEIGDLFKSEKERRLNETLTSYAMKNDAIHYNNTKQHYNLTSNDDYKNHSSTSDVEHPGPSYNNQKNLSQNFKLKNSTSYEHHNTPQNHTNPQYKNLTSNENNKGFQNHTKPLDTFGSQNLMSNIHDLIKPPGKNGSQPHKLTLNKNVTFDRNYTKTLGHQNLTLMRDNQNYTQLSANQRENELRKTRIINESIANASSTKSDKRGVVVPLPPNPTLQLEDVKKPDKIEDIKIEHVSIPIQDSKIKLEETPVIPSIDLGQLNEKLLIQDIPPVDKPELTKSEPKPNPSIENIKL